MKTNPNEAAFGFGISKREYFAALAMQGQLSNNIAGVQFDQLAKMAVSQADALIAALNEVKP